MLSAISNGLDLDTGLTRILQDPGGSPAARPGTRAQAPAWPAEDRAIPDTTLSRNPPARSHPREPSGTAVRHSPRRTALLPRLVLPAVTLAAPVYFLFPLPSRPAAPAAHLILAVFLAVPTLGVITMVAVAVRREAHGALSSTAPGAAGRRARRLVGRLVDRAL